MNCADLISMNFYIKTYGCQMNVADSEIIASILEKNDFKEVKVIENADVVLFNTCSIRDKAERTLIYELDFVKHLKKNKNIAVGILGCMAQRLKNNLLKHECIDFVVGPDCYRKLPEIIDAAFKNKKTTCTIFDQNEHYSDINPKFENKISAFIPITKGCNNMCSYCVVPYTRGIEKNRDIDSILEEVKNLSKNGYKKITLLGENVNSYHYKTYTFADLLEEIAKIDKKIRIHFTSSHPKDLTEKLIDVISKYYNICKHIHLPVQSGSNKILKLMNRPYTKEQYIEIIKMIKKRIPECSITTDIMTGFCDETEEDHLQTLELMEDVKFDSSFTFAYSERSGTKSALFMEDNVDEKTKSRRLKEIIKLQQKHSMHRYNNKIGKICEILVEGKSNKNEKKLFGKTSDNKMVFFENIDNEIMEGDFVEVKIEKSTSTTLQGSILSKIYK